MPRSDSGGTNRPVHVTINNKGSGSGCGALLLWIFIILPILALIFTMAVQGYVSDKVGDVELTLTPEERQELEQQEETR